jgi:cellulose synthase/poly-beta-1,6-N-acetylglucosamine synthase-like glycosyltransferase
MQMKEISMENQTQLNVVDLMYHPKINLEVGDLVKFNGSGVLGWSNSVWNEDTILVVKCKLNNQYYILYCDGIEVHCYKKYLCKIIN